MDQDLVVNSLFLYIFLIFINSRGAKQTKLGIYKLPKHLKSTIFYVSATYIFGSFNFVVIRNDNTRLNINIKQMALKKITKHTRG